MQNYFYTLVNQRTVEPPRELSPLPSLLLFKNKFKLQYFKNIKSVHVAAAVSEF